MKRLATLVMGLALVACAASAWAAAASGSPSASATIQERVQPVDGRGVELQMSSLGYKAFVLYGSTSPVQVVDEAGNAPKSGLLHAICVSSGATTDDVVALDSATTTGITSALVGNSTKELLPPVMRIAATERCQAGTLTGLDVQFNNGLVVMDSTSTAFALILWRPNGATRQ